MHETYTDTKLLRNTLFNSGGKLASYLVGLVLTPVILNELGNERFGFWTLILLFAGHFGLFDLGFGAALTKHVAECNAAKTMHRIRAPFTMAIGFYTLASGALLILLWFLRFPLFRFFSVPRSFWNELQYIVPAAVLIFLFTSILSALQSLISGLQRMAITNGVAVLQALLTVVLTILLLRRGYGLYGVIGATLVALVVGTVLLGFFSKRLMPELKFVSLAGDGEVAAVLRFGVMVQIAAISAVVATCSDRLLIGHFLGLIALAQYQVGYTVVVAMRGITLLLVSAVVPATSELWANKNHAGLEKLYLRGTKYSLVAGLAVATVILTLAPKISHAWLGREEPSVVLVMRFLGVGHLFHVLTGLGTAMCKGMGRPEMEAKFGLGLTLLQIGFGMIGVRAFGLVGLLGSTALVMAATSSAFLYKFHRWIVPRQSFPWRTLVVKPVSASVVAACLALGTSAWVGSSLESRPAGALLSLLVPATILFAAYGCFLLASGYLDSFDRGLVYRLCRSLTPARSLLEAPRR